MKLKESGWSASKIKKAIDRAIDDEGAFIFVKEKHEFNLITFVLLEKEIESYSFLELHDETPFSDLNKMHVSGREEFYSSFPDFIEVLNLKIIFINKEIKKEMLTNLKTKHSFRTVALKYYPEIFI